MKLILLGVVIAGAFFLISDRGYAQRNDFLGAHVNYGHGCSACHFAHSPEFRDERGEVSNSPMLWGKDVSSTYAPQYRTLIAEGKRAESPEVRGILVCISCHGGNYATAAMKKATTYEPLPDGMGAGHSIPTYADKPAVDFGARLSEHPIGANARIGCGVALGWDCEQSDGALQMTGVHSSKFAANYGFFIKPATQGKTSEVLCTTCHNPHAMTVTEVTSQTASTLFQPGYYSTSHFLRTPLGSVSPSRTSNVSAQFCRQCHAELSNEMNGSSARTMM